MVLIVVGKDVYSVVGRPESDANVDAFVITSSVYLSKYKAGSVYVVPSDVFDSFLKVCESTIQGLDMFGRPDYGKWELVVSKVDEVGDG